jgi:hypothetical protein
MRFVILKDGMMDENYAFVPRALDLHNLVRKRMERF